MCLILLAHKAHPDYPLILAANRDEAYARPAEPAAFWPDHPEVYGGRDLEQGGTWLGLALNGRVAAVTNFREGRNASPVDAALSRGTLVSRYLTGDEPVERYLEQVQGAAARYRGFILIGGDLERLFWFSNRGPGIERILPGVHGLSNHLLDTPWPKIVRGKEVLTSLLAAGETEVITGLFDVLGDRSESSDRDLPDTGVGLARERRLSANFISDDRYGTRASTVVLVDTRGTVRFIERTYGTRGEFLGQTDRRFPLQPASTIATADGPHDAALIQS